MTGFDLIIVLVIGGAIAYAFGWRPPFNLAKPAQTSPTPLEILKARCARGEITREEYDQMHQELES